MNSLKEFMPVQPQAALARAVCPCCNKPVTIKANKKGIAYFFCPHDDESGGNCAHRQHFGQRISAELRKLYHDNGQERVVVQLPLRPGKVVRFDGQTAANKDRAPVAKPANINTAPPEPRPERANGLFGG